MQITARQGFLFSLVYALFTYNTPTHIHTRTHTHSHTLSLSLVFSLSLYISLFHFLNRFQHSTRNRSLHTKNNFDYTHALTFCICECVCVCVCALLSALFSVVLWSFISNYGLQKCWLLLLAGLCQLQIRPDDIPVLIVMQFEYKYLPELQLFSYLQIN